MTLTQGASLKATYFAHPEGNFRVYHVSFFDQRTSCACLGDCLSQLDSWSQVNPTHDPLVVYLEPRGFATNGIVSCYLHSVTYLIAD